MSSYELDPITGLRRNQSPTGVNTLVNFQPGVGPTIGGGTSTGVGGGGTPAAPRSPQSFQDFLSNDPFWRQLNADLSAQGISDEAGARAGVQRAVIGFGEAPDNLTGLAANWIDPTTRQLAAQNTSAGLSQVARMNKLRDDNLRAIKNVLAARGGLRSGEFGYQLGENQQQYAEAQYDARNRLLDIVSQYNNAYAQGQRAAQMARAQGLGQVASGYYSQPPYGGAPPPATPPATPPQQPPTENVLPPPPRDPFLENELRPRPGFVPRGGIAF